MNRAKTELERKFSYIVNNYHIPINNIVGAVAGCAVEVGRLLPFVAVGNILSAKKERKTKHRVVDGDFTGRKITSADIPDDILNIDHGKFYELLCGYSEARGYDEVTLYKRALISKAVYSNIRSMSIKKDYTPSKNTVLALCLALHLTLPQSAEMLELVGYTFSDNIKVDKVVSWCLEQVDLEYDDVAMVNDVIYDKIGESPFIKR